MSERLISRVLQVLPAFRARWMKYAAEQEGCGERLYSLEIAELARFVSDDSGLSSRQLSELFDFVEEVLANGADAEKDLVATCFLENLANAVSAGHLSAARIVPFLGRRSKEFWRAWDDFTGLTTENL
jgi:hypothetical protein